MTDQAYWDEWARRDQERSDPDPNRGRPAFLPLKPKEVQDIVEHSILTTYAPAIGFEVCVHNNERYSLYLANRAGGYVLWTYWKPRPGMPIKEYWP